MVSVYIASRMNKRDRVWTMASSALTPFAAAEQEEVASEDAHGQDGGGGGGVSEPEWWNAGWFDQQGVNKENRSWGDGPRAGPSKRQRDAGSSRTGAWSRDFSESSNHAESMHDLGSKTPAESKPQRNWKVRVGPPKKPNGKPWVSLSALLLD